MTPPAATNHRPIVLVGYGDIAGRLAQRLADRDIVAIARHVPKRPAEHRGQWRGLALDLDRQARPIEADAPGAIWVYLAPPAREGQTDQRVERWLSGGTPAPAGMVYVSTTGVYGDRHGDWIDESTKATPSHDRGRRRLDAERQFHTMATDSGIPLTVLRVTGIYSCDRLPLEKIRHGAPIPISTEAPWSNRIHAEDLADILYHLIERIEAQRPVIGTFNVSDNQPSPVSLVYRQIAAHFGLPQPPEAPLAIVLDQASPMAREFLSESRRIDASAIQKALEWQPRYPTLAAALIDCSPSEY